VNAARVKRNVGEIPNIRKEGTGKGVDGDGESMMSEKWGARATSLAARIASVTNMRHASAACPEVGMIGGGAAGSSLYCWKCWMRVCRMGLATTAARRRK